MLTIGGEEVISSEKHINLKHINSCIFNNSTNSFNLKEKIEVRIYKNIIFSKLQLYNVSQED